MKKKKKKFNIKEELINFILDEWKFILFCVVLTIVLLFPLDYYITTGGGISDIDNRVIIEDSYSSKGSLNISFVEQVKGDIFTYGLSYIMPNWEREKIDNYKISDDDNIKDIEFRNKLDLEYSNSNATYWGYKLAKEDIKLVSSNIYVIYVFKEYNSKFKVQDELVSMDGNTFEKVLDYKKYLNSLQEGDIVKVKILRDNKVKVINSKVYNNKGENIIGVALTTINKYKTSKKIEFKFKGNESGPSGGLMTTLDIYNKLTKKDLTNGLKIAGTGTIELDGSIGEIGGVKHKVLGAAKDKADIFLVPEGNYKECMKTVKDNNLKIKVIKVKKIQDAINVLSKFKGRLYENRY